MPKEENTMNNDVKNVYSKKNTNEHNINTTNQEKFNWVFQENKGNMKKENDPIEIILEEKEKEIDQLMD